MNKYFLFLIFLVCQSSAMQILHGGVNDLSKKQFATIVEKANDLGIKDTSQIKTVRSWWNGGSYEKKYRESIVIKFKPHIEEKYYAVNNYLSCSKNIGENWNCQNKEQFFIRFAVNQEMNITIAYKQAVTNIDVLVEVARAANNLRPMSWEQPISAISIKPIGDYWVAFGTYASYCVRYLTIRRDSDRDANKYSVVWDKTSIDTCASIGGYIDTTKLYVIYENDKWISD